MIDLEALLPTRRFFNVVMDDCHLVTYCHLSALNRRPEGKLFSQVSQPIFSNIYRILGLIGALVRYHEKQL